MLRRKDGAWSLTPEGHEKVKAILADLDAGSLQAELASVPGAEFSHTLHTLIPHPLAPVKWAAPIKRLLDRFPFEANVFCMTRFPKDEDDTGFLDPVQEVIDTIRAALAEHGLALHLASNRQIDDDLLANVAGYMWACKYGLALFEARRDGDLNKNMLIEVGSMLITGRRTALLRDVNAPDMPTDLVGQIRKDVDFDDLTAVRDVVHRWVAHDLDLGRCSNCPE